MLDRIDLQLVLQPVTIDQLESDERGESSAEVAGRVAQARQMQAARCACGDTHAPLNAALAGVDLDRVAKPTGAALGQMRTAVDHFGLSARGYAKVRRVARTIADLEGSDRVRPSHFDDALRCRRLDLLGDGSSARPAA